MLGGIFPKAEKNYYINAPNWEEIDNMLKLFIKEFWVPIVVAVGWSVYNVYGLSASYKVRDIINIFAPTFFLVSWMTGQYFRIKKQQKVEDSFGTLDKRLDAIIENFRKSSEDILSNISGGNSFPYIQIGNINNTTKTGQIVVLHQGSYPLYDVQVRIVDLRRFQVVQGNIADFGETSFSVGNMIPSHCVVMPNAWNIGEGTKQSYNVFMTARNGAFTQLIRLDKGSGEWKYATKVINSRGETVLEQIKEGFPLESDGIVNWN